MGQNTPTACQPKQKFSRFLVLHGEDESEKQRKHRNGSTCLMLVNKDQTLDVAGEQPHKPEQVFAPLQENSPAVQLSKKETIHLHYETKLRRTLELQASLSASSVKCLTQTLPIS